MVWIVSAILLGLGLGVLGYYHSKTAYSLFVISMALFVFLSSYAKGLMSQNYSGSADIYIPIGEDGTTSAEGLGYLMFNAVDHMGALPQHIQLSIILFAVAFFVARIGTWVFTKLSVEPDRVETNAERKQRILAQYSMKEIPR